MKVLVIDDETFVRTIVAEMLEMYGHQVIQAASGADGLALLDAEGGVDLVLTDLGMPGMTGWAVATAVKERYPAVKVGVISGWGATLVTRPLDHTAVDFVIPKPVSDETLRAALAGLAAG